MPWEETGTAGTGFIIHEGWATAAGSGAFYLSNITTNTNLIFTSANTSGGFGFGGGIPIWDPVQAEQARADYEKLMVERERKRRRAEVKARKLFKRVVGAIAYQRFRERGYHEICGASYTRYRLRPGLRVQVMEEDERNSERVAHELCAHLPFGIPWYDSMAVQHLMLTASRKTEDQFKKVANKHTPHGPYPVPQLTAVA